MFFTTYRGSISVKVLVSYEERNNKKKATYLPRGSTGKYSGNFDGPSRVGVPDTASRILFQTMMLMLGDRLDIRGSYGV